jgi:hypothetical protein
MTALLLNPTVFFWLLVAAALATPLGAWLGHRWSGVQPRTWLAVGAFGPVALILWGVHNLVLGVVGFDSIFSVAIMLGLGLAIGWLTGRWAASDLQPREAFPKATTAKDQTSHLSEGNNQ